MNYFPSDENLYKLLNPGQTDMEDNFIERKSSYQPKKILKTLVAFANSVPADKYAILFIGITNEGEHNAVPDLEDKQQDIRRLCSDVCYPPITEYKTRIVKKDDREPFMAVVVLENTEKPYFTGRAYIRRGSSNVYASEEEYQRLIAMRTHILYQISQWEPNQLVTVITHGRDLGKHSARGPAHRDRKECLIEKWDLHKVTFEDTDQQRYWAEPVSELTLSHDESKYRPMILVGLR